jgi:hypothetical protein
MLLKLSEVLIFFFFFFFKFLEPNRHFTVEIDSNILTVWSVPIIRRHRDSTVYAHSNIIICNYHFFDLVLMWNEYFEHQNLQAVNMYLCTYHNIVFWSLHAVIWQNVWKMFQLVNLHCSQLHHIASGFIKHILINCYQN